MNKFVFNDYFQEPQGKIAKRMIFKSDNVIAFILNISKGEIIFKGEGRTQRIITKRYVENEDEK